jgi:predicted Zn finger-like uncharacterized protein
MALATRCPNCNALFRVGAEQLRSRGGMVRCGSCRRVFNAIAGLDYMEGERLAVDATNPPKAAPPTAPRPVPDDLPVDRAAALAPASAKASAAPLPPASTKSRRQRPTPATPPAPYPKADSHAPSTAPVAADTRPESAATRATDADSGVESADAAQADFSVADPGAESTTDVGHGTSFDEFLAGHEAGAEDRAAAAMAESTEDDSHSEPSFLRGSDESPGRSARVALALASAVLAPLLVIELALIYRSPLLVAFPTLRPALQALCAPLACAASWPMRPDLLAVVSSELQSVPGTDALELDTVLRNRAGFPLALPAIELTVSNDVGQAVARKVFLPADYLRTSADSGADPAAGNIAAGADLAVRVLFELPGVSAAGFEAYPFYP